jgi:hypothetical protein
MKKRAKPPTVFSVITCHQFISLGRSKGWVNQPSAQEKRTKETMLQDKRALDLSIDDINETEGVGHHHDGNKGKDKSQFITDHLSHTSNRAQKAIFGVGGPTPKGNSIDAEGREGENIEDADWEIRITRGTGLPRRWYFPNGNTAKQQGRRGATAGAKRGSSAPSGTVSSLATNLMTSAMGCKSPNRPARLGP